MRQPRIDTLPPPHPEAFLGLKDGCLSQFEQLFLMASWIQLVSAPRARPQDEQRLNQAGAREEMNSSTWTRAGGTALLQTQTIKASSIMGHEFSKLSKERWVTNVLSWKTWSKAFWVNRNLQPKRSIGSLLEAAGS